MLFSAAIPTVNASTSSDFAAVCGREHPDSVQRIQLENPGFRCHRRPASAPTERRVHEPLHSPRSPRSEGWSNRGGFGMTPPRGLRTNRPQRGGQTNSGGADLSRATPCGQPRPGRTPLESRSRIAAGGPRVGALPVAQESVLLMSRHRADVKESHGLVGSSRIEVRRFHLHCQFK